MKLGPRGRFQMVVEPVGAIQDSFESNIQKIQRKLVRFDPENNMFVSHVSSQELKYRFMHAPFVFTLVEVIQHVFESRVNSAAPLPQSANEAQEQGAPLRRQEPRQQKPSTQSELLFMDGIQTPRKKMSGIIIKKCACACVLAAFLGVHKGNQSQTEHCCCREAKGKRYVFVGHHRSQNQSLKKSLLRCSRLKTWVQWLPVLIFKKRIIALLNITWDIFAERQLLP